VADGYRVAQLDDFELKPWRETLTGRVRHELGITAFGVNSWVGPNVGDRVIPEHAEDQEGDQDELYIVVRGRARFEIGGDNVDAPQGTLVYVPAGPTMRTAFAEEPDTSCLRSGPRQARRTRIMAGSCGPPLNGMFQAGDYEGVIAKGRESIEANPQFGMPLPGQARGLSMCRPRPSRRRPRKGRNLDSGGRRWPACQIGWHGSSREPLEGTGVIYRPLTS
jgi:hypothetical protein